MMKPAISRLTYANVVGTLALFIALGGVGYAAAKLPKNSVGSAQIKKNAVTSSKIKKRAVTGSKIKSQTITGDKIQLSTLATVPSASSATTASAVGGQLAPVFKRGAVSASDADPEKALAAAADVPLLASGGITLIGKCYRSGANIYGAIGARTTVDATIHWNGTTAFFGVPYLNQGKPDSSMTFKPSAPVAANQAAPLLGGPAYLGQGIVITPDGHGLRYGFGGFVKNGTLASGDGLYGPGDSCLFSATASVF